MLHNFKRLTYLIPNISFYPITCIPPTPRQVAMESPSLSWVRYDWKDKTFEGTLGRNH